MTDRGADRVILRAYAGDVLAWMLPRLCSMQMRRRLALVTLGRLEQVAELEAAAVDSALGRGEAHVERRRDFIVRRSGQVAQHDRLSVRERELRKRAEDPRAEVVRFGGRL